MKKSFAVVLGVLMVFVCAGSSQAFMRKDMSLVKGRIVAHDSQKAVLTVDGERGEGKVSFDISGADVQTSTNKGDRVVVIYKIDGNRATIVKPVPAGR